MPFAGFHHAHLEPFARQELGAQCTGDLVEIDDFDVMQLGYFVKVKIAGHQLPIEMLCEQHQLHVDRLAGKLGKLAVIHHEIQAFASAQSIQDIKTPAAANTTQFIGTVRNGLQLEQDEARHHQLAIQNARLRKFGKSSVNDTARIQDQRLDPLEVARKLHVRDDESKVIFGLKQQADAGVAKNRHRRERNISLKPVALQHRIHRNRQQIREQYPNQQTEVNRRDNLNSLPWQKHIGRHDAKSSKQHSAKNQIRHQWTQNLEIR